MESLDLLDGLGFPGPYPGLLVHVPAGVSLLPGQGPPVDPPLFLDIGLNLGGSSGEVLDLLPGGARDLGLPVGSLLHVVAQPDQPATAVAGSGCQSVDAAAAVVTGEETRQVAEEAYRQSAAQYAQNVTVHSQTAAHVNGEPPGAFSVASLFSPSSSPAIDPSASSGTGSGGPTGQAAEYYLQNLTDPEPPARPSGANYATPAGRRYLAELKTYRARMSLAHEEPSPRWPPGTRPPTRCPGGCPRAWGGSGLRRPRPTPPG